MTIKSTSSDGVSWMDKVSEPCGIVGGVKRL